MGVLNRSFKSIWRRKGRTIAALLAVAVAMAIMVAIPAGLSASQSAVESSQNKLATSLDSMQSSYANATTLITVSFGNFRGGFNQNSSSSTTVSYVTADELTEVEELENVSSVVGYIQKTAGLPSTSSSSSSSSDTPGMPGQGGSGGGMPSFDFSSMYVVYGLPLDNGTIDGLTPTVSEGSWLSGDNLNEAVVSSALADE